ncbi:hypothetical protein CEXT_513731 [Caerostris extrusa]|uniref:Uncharacterized protein n=1 Tax=Caerostris extrusa TaxID=172846 RepID=A0AAV4NLV0_CAEEX|nr:hypothetical protein CEXT_513731 [Caerostris extrusa]
MQNRGNYPKGSTRIHCLHIIVGWSSFTSMAQHPHGGIRLQIRLQTAVLAARDKRCFSFCRSRAGTMAGTRPGMPWPRTRT